MARLLPSHPNVPLDSLRDVSAWRSTGPPGGAESAFGLLSYLSCVATPDLLFAFAELLAPDLIEHEGSYFIAERFDERSYDEWRTKLADGRDIERVLNHIHISSLFQDQDVTSETAMAAANLIAETWTRRFQPLGLIGVALGDSFDTAEVTLHRAP